MGIFGGNRRDPTFRYGLRVLLKQELGPQQGYIVVGRGWDQSTGEPFYTLSPEDDGPVLFAHERWLKVAEQQKISAQPDDAAWEAFKAVYLPYIKHK